jgi:DNA polymerase-1
MLYRAFFALPKSIKGTVGRPVNALLGTANLVVREIEQHDPRAVVLCFGPDAATYRTELFDGYHAQRPEMPDLLREQWDVAEEFFTRFGWTVADHDSLEADDLLGSLADAEVEAGGEALLMTGDRDMFQCARDGVTILYVSTGGKRGGELIDAAEVKKRYGIPPELVPDFIALRGDPSDGIPGAKGVGEKTAADLLTRHGSLDSVLDNALREATPRLRGALSEREQLLAYREIARLQDAGVDRPPDQPTDWAGAAAAAEEFGMNALAKRLNEKA